jgi:hypothetical protein
VTYQWVDCDRSAASRRYDRIAHLTSLFDRLFFVPWGVLAEIADDVEMQGNLFSPCYIWSTTKPFFGAASGDFTPGAEYRIAAE